MRLFGSREALKEKGHIYKMHEKLVSIGDDYWIEDETGERRTMLMESTTHPQHPHSQRSAWK